MKYRQLGGSELRVSEISLGSWLTYSGGIDRSRSEACVRKALELGINFFDTANVYGRGAAEDFLGEVLQPLKRSSYLLATKLYFPMTDRDYGLSAKQVQKQIDASLKRLRTDYLDLYQCHRYDEQTALEETMEALSQVVRQGKARYVGFSEWSPDQIRASLSLPGEHFVSSQPQYSMLWRRPEKEVFPLCAENGIGQIVWSPLAQGILTGKYSPGKPPPKDSRATSPSMGGFLDRYLDLQILASVQQLKPIAQKAGLTMSQLALAWVLRHPNVASGIIGATRPEQVVENAAASGVTLSPETIRDIDQALAPALARIPQ
jgi:aryl-alcohol dehydrogenase-like predicted oxidoreductase